MPQMAPMNWIILFMIFIFLMMMVLNKIYFILEKKMSLNTETMKNMNKNSIKWMW